MKKGNYKNESILLNEHWKEELKSLPFVTHVSTIFNTDCFIRKKDAWFHCSSKNQRLLFRENLEQNMRRPMYSNKEKFKKEIPPKDQEEGRAKIRKCQASSRQNKLSHRSSKDMIQRNERSLMYLFQKLFKS